MNIKVGKKDQAKHNKLIKTNIKVGKKDQGQARGKT